MIGRSVGLSHTVPSNQILSTSVEPGGDSSRLPVGATLDAAVLGAV